MSTIFITGADGFVGKHLCAFLKTKNIHFIPAVRKASSPEQVFYGDLNQKVDWAKHLVNIDVVVHLAARVHVMSETENNPLRSFLMVNKEATLALAAAAKEREVKRFIYLSTIKVNGEQTFSEPFTASDLPKPEDDYGRSKLEAELGLMKLHEAGKFDVIIIRPPLIYGPGVKANFANLIKLVKLRLPLPFGCIKSKRSYLSVFNLCDLIQICCTHPRAAGQIFLASDGMDLSLAELIRRIGTALNIKTVLLPIPSRILILAAELCGKKSFSDRLFGNLQVDISKTKSLLNWTPTFTLDSKSIS